MANGQLGGAAQKALGLQPQFSSTAILEADPEYTGARTRLGGLEAKREKAAQEYQAATAPLKAKVEAERGELEKMQPPQLQEIPDKFVPTKMDPKEQQDMMSTMFMFATLGGMMTRQPMTAALNSFAGALEGLRSGNMEKYKKEHEVFQTNMRVAQAKNQEYIQKFDMAVKKRRGDIQGLMEDIKLLNLEYGNTVQSVNAERQDLRSLMQGKENLAKGDVQMAAQLKKLDQHHAEVMARMAQQQAQFEAKQAGAGAGAAPPVDQKTVDMLAQRYVAGDPAALTGLGYAKNAQPMRDAVLKRAAEISQQRGMTGADISGAKAGYAADASSLRQYQNYVNRVEALGGKIDKDINTLFTVAEKGVGPSGIPLFDKYLQKGRKALGDPDIAAFETQIQTVKNEYGRSMSGPASNAQLHVAAMKHADDLINSAQNLDQLKAVVKIMRQDIKNQSDQAKEQINEIKSRLSQRASGGQPIGGGVQDSAKVLKDADAILGIK